MVFPQLRVTFPQLAAPMAPKPDATTEEDLAQGISDLFVGVIIMEQPDEADDKFPLVDAAQMCNWTASDLPTRREFR